MEGLWRSNKHQHHKLVRGSRLARLAAVRKATYQCRLFAVHGPRCGVDGMLIRLYRMAHMCTF